MNAPLVNMKAGAVAIFAPQESTAVAQDLRLAPTVLLVGTVLLLEQHHPTSA